MGPRGECECGCPVSMRGMRARLETRGVKREQSEALRFRGAFLFFSQQCSGGSRCPVFSGAAERAQPTRPAALRAGACLWPCVSICVLVWSLHRPVASGRMTRSWSPAFIFVAASIATSRASHVGVKSLDRLKPFLFVLFPAQRPSSRKCLPRFFLLHVWMQDIDDKDGPMLVDVRRGSLLRR